MAKQIPLFSRKKIIGYTTVDDEFEWLAYWRWRKHPSGYAYRTKNGKFIYMHRVILRAMNKELCDHIDGKKDNNLLSNLRICDDTGNARNKGFHKNNKSGYIGVFKLDRCKSKPYIAYIIVNRKRIHLGYYSSAREAAIVRDEAAKKHHKQFARLNFP